MPLFLWLYNSHLCLAPAFFILRSMKIYLQNRSSFAKIKLKKEYRWINLLSLKQEAFILMFLLWSPTSIKCMIFSSVFKFRTDKGIDPFHIYWLISAREFSVPF